MHQLCFEVTANSLAYTIFDTKESTVVCSNQLGLPQRAEELKLEAASAFLREEKLLDFDGEVSLAYASEKVTLIPQAIFGDSSAKDLFGLAFGQSDLNIEHNRFFEQALVVTFEIEPWVKRFFVIRFPRIVIQSSATHLLRGIFNQPSFEMKLHLSCYERFLIAVLVGKNKILGFNSFTIDSEADIAFYSLHLLKSCEIDIQKVKVIWYQKEGGAEKSEVQTILNAASPNHEIDFRSMSRMKHQLLCV